MFSMVLLDIVFADHKHQVMLRWQHYISHHTLLALHDLDTNTERATVQSYQCNHALGVFTGVLECNSPLPFPNHLVETANSLHVHH